MVEWVMQYLRTRGPIFTQWGVDAELSQLAGVLHTNSWYQYGELDSCIVAPTVGRQGCKLGGIIFKIVYNEALDELTVLLVESGVVQSITKAGAFLFWLKHQN